MIRDIWGNAKGPAKRDIFCSDPDCAQHLRIISIGESLYGLAYPSETITQAIRRIKGIEQPKRMHGGARPGSGPKPRTDGRKLRIVKVALNDEEFEAVKHELDTDDRRKALIRAILNKYQK
jgi:hypothetical protein